MDEKDAEEDKALSMFCIVRSLPSDFSGTWFLVTNPLLGK
jgi:hypothetical protein